jgi:glutamine synthetase
MLMAVIDGVQNKISPGDPLDCDIYSLDEEASATIARTPESLSQALDALAADHEYLLRDDVFTPDVIDTWIQTKRDHEVRPMQTRPHPHEFNLYYDC